MAKSWNRGNGRSPEEGRDEEQTRPRTVVVTGASAGVGRATVREFARRGARLGLLARGVDRLEATKREVEAMGSRAVAIPTDVGGADQVERAAERVEQELGPIDVWINNAMVTVLSPFEEMKPEEFHRVTEVTYIGTVHGTSAALRRMRPRNRGTIVQVGSALVYRSIPLQSAYCGAKAAIRGFTDSLRCELHHENSDIHLTMVQLPAVNTPQFEWCRSRMDGQPQPMPPIYEPEVAARAIEWASRSERREVCVGGSSAFTILGQRAAPGAMDRYLGRTGYDAQIVEGTRTGHASERPGNLFEPVDGDHAAHGRFHERSHRHSPQAELSRHRGWVAAGLGALAAGVSAFALTRSNGGR